MKYRLRAYGIQHIGQRDNQEDSLFPAINDINDDARLFILCDGMGGHEKGEVASQTVCDTMSASIFSQISENRGGFEAQMIQRAVEEAIIALNAKDDGAVRKMGTTMTLLMLHDNGATIAHIGDSRVYHIRQGSDAGSTNIIHVTRDHSLVSDLVSAGVITADEARHHPQRNVITRALQPHPENIPKAQIYETTDIQAGDYFYLCSDGMLEQMDDENIRFNFSTKITDDIRRIDVLQRATQNNSDNHTAFIIRIMDVTGKPLQSAAADTVILSDSKVVSTDDSAVTSAVNSAATSSASSPRATLSPFKNKKKPILLTMLLSIAIVVVCCFTIKFVTTKDKSDDDTVELTDHERALTDEELNLQYDTPRTTPRTKNKEEKKAEDKQKDNTSSDNNDPAGTPANTPAPAPAANTDNAPAGPADKNPAPAPAGISPE